MVSTRQPLAPRMYLKFNGANASEEMMDSVISIEVDDSLSLPDMFAIHLRDSGVKWIDDDTFSLGTTVEISAKNGGSEVKLMSGEITAIEPRFTSSTGPTLLLRGYDRSHRLNRGKQTKSFVQMTDSDIAAKIAKEVGLKSKIDTTRQVHDYVLQENQSNWEFLTQRAQRIGYRVFVEDNALHFVKAPDGGGQSPVLEWAIELLEFNARMSTARQVSEVVVQGWDPNTQKQIMGRAATPQDTPQIGESRQGGQAAEEAFGIAAKKIVVDRPVATQAEADVLAQSICDEIGQGFIEAECVCFGNPAVQAGMTVQLQGLGTRFSGSYRVTHALHRYIARRYTTEFSIGGRHATTIGEILSAGNSGHSNHSPMLGVVTNNKDPDDLGRVKVKFPTLKDGEESTWARYVSPGGGKNRGFMWLPEVGDEVLVVFEHEDIHRPFVLGGVWSRQNEPPGHVSKIVDSQGKVIGRGLESLTHQKLVVSDAPDYKSIELQNDGADVWIRVCDTDKEVQIKSTGNVWIKADKDVFLLSDGKVAIEGGGIEIKSNGKLSLKGAQVEIKSDANMDIQAGAMLNAKANANCIIKGALVQIN